MHFCQSLIMFLDIHKKHKKNLIFQTLIIINEPPKIFFRTKLIYIFWASFTRVHFLLSSPVYSDKLPHSHFHARNTKFFLNYLFFRIK